MIKTERMVLKVKNLSKIVGTYYEIYGRDKVNKPIFFEGIEFPVNTWLRGKYRFDSYRFTYRYDFRPSERLVLGIGVTAKIRDAAISIEDDMQKSEKLNTGFVPLINFRC